MKFYITIVFLLIVNVFASQKIVLPGREPVVELTFDGKKLVFEENSSDIKKDEILELFEKYKSCVSKRDVESLMNLFVDNDKFVKSLNSEESKERWLEIAKRVKSYQVLAFMVDEKSNLPTDVLYLVDKEQTGRTVVNMSVLRENGSLKITSNILKPDSPQYQLRDWWTKNYPAKPKVLYSNVPLSVDKLETHSSSRVVFWVIITPIVLLLCTIVAMKLKNRKR